MQGSGLWAWRRLLAVCGEQVSFYPPGIPVLLPGEVITREIVEYCKAMKALGLPVSGPADNELKSIRIVH